MSLTRGGWVSPPDVTSRGGYHKKGVYQRGGYPRGVWVSQEGGTLPISWCMRYTYPLWADTCENITFPQLRWRAVITGLKMRLPFQILVSVSSWNWKRIWTSWGLRCVFLCQRFTFFIFHASLCSNQNTRWAWFKYEWTVPEDTVPTNIYTSSYIKHHTVQYESIRALEHSSIRAFKH